MLFAGLIWLGSAAVVVEFVRRAPFAKEDDFIPSDHLETSTLRDGRDIPEARPAHRSPSHSTAARGPYRCATPTSAN